MLLPILKVGNSFVYHSEYSMSHDNAPASAHLGRYVLITKIAVGGVADIYLAKTKSLTHRDRYLVLKCLRADAKSEEDFLETILNEALLSVQLRHPNIVEVFDLCEVQAEQFLAMEYLDAHDLSSVLAYHIQHDDYLPFGLALYAIREIATGLHYAHELKDSENRPLGLVHRDISPQNILLSSAGDIKLSDFGIAKTNLMRDKTPEGVIKGKFHYMSPEQAWGDRVDRRSDIFSLGIVLYEAIVGQEAYPYEGVATLIEKARIAQFPEPRKLRPEIPPELEALLLKALDLDKQARYQSAKEFADAIDDYLRKHHPRANRVTWLEHLNSIQDRGAKLPLLHAADYVRDIHSMLPQNKSPNPQQNSEDSEITEQYDIVDVQRAKNEKLLSTTAQAPLPKPPSLRPYIFIAVALLVLIAVAVVYFIFL